MNLLQLDSIRAARERWLPQPNEAGLIERFACYLERFEDNGCLDLTPPPEAFLAQLGRATSPDASLCIVLYNFFYHATEFVADASCGYERKRFRRRAGVSDSRRRFMDAHLGPDAIAAHCEHAKQATHRYLMSRLVNYCGYARDKWGRSPIAGLAAELLCRPGAFDIGEAFYRAGALIEAGALDAGWRVLDHWLNAAYRIRAWDESSFEWLEALVAERTLAPHVLGRIADVAGGELDRVAARTATLQLVFLLQGHSCAQWTPVALSLLARQTLDAADHERLRQHLLGAGPAVLCGPLPQFSSTVQRFPCPAVEPIHREWAMNLLSRAGDAAG